MKLDIHIGELDQSILKWLDKADSSDITNVIYHGWKIVTNPEYNKKLDAMIESTKLEVENQILKDSVDFHKKQIKQHQCQYNEQLDISISDMKVRYEKEYTDRLREKDDLIVEMRNTLIPQLLSDKERLITEKNERLAIQAKVQTTLEHEISMTKTRCSELESIMSNSNKKGEYAENKLNEMLIENISNDMTIKLESKKKHSADIHIQSKEYNGVILVESKFYNDKSEKNMYSEIEKFKSDIDTCKGKMEVFSAIFVSYTCDIPGINSFKCVDEKGIRCYYFANMTEDKFNLLYQIVELEHWFYKKQKISEGNESMNKYLMRVFKEISEYYKRIENLSPGYIDIKKVVDSVEVKYNKELKKILTDIKLKSDTFTKLTNINSKNHVELQDLFSINSPHELNIPQFECIKAELVQSRVEKNELDKTHEERDDLMAIVAERDKTISDQELAIRDYDKKATRKAKKKNTSEQNREIMSIN
jgi:hypothetical protein